jgi:hypothetical protein
VPDEPAVSGTIRVDPRDGTALDVPWTLVTSPPPDDLIGDVELSEETFSPSDLTPAVLAVRVGTIVSEDGRDMIEPARRFDVLLQDDRGRTLGLLARLRDVLPGRYAFGITGRGPNGKPLRDGPYRLRLAAWPAAGGEAVVRTVPFSGVREERRRASTAAGHSPSNDQGATVSTVDAPVSHLRENP